MKINMKLIGLSVLFCGVFFSGLSQNFRISGSNTHSVALCSDGTVFAWGTNDGGQVGLNPATLTPYPNASYNEPQIVGGLSEIFQIDAGSGSHTLAMTCEGRVYAWGANATRQLGNPIDATGAFSATPVFVRRGLAPDVNGDGLLGGVQYVSGGNDESFAILTDGRLVAWGQNDKGQLGNGATSPSSPTPVFVISGVSQFGQTNGDPLNSVVQVEAGDENGYALTEDGRVWSWGDNNSNALGRSTLPMNRAMPILTQAGTPITNIVSITAGDRHALMIDDKGVVWSVGGDWGPGQRGSGPAYVDVNYAVRVDAGQQFGGGTYLGDSDPIVEIAAGQAHSMAVSASGRVYTWGALGFFNCGNGCSSPAGQLGTGQTQTGTTAAGAELPRLAQYAAGNTVITNAIGISDGDAWTFVLTDDNKIYVAGWNQNGELGIGNTTNQSRFVELDLASLGCGFVVPEPQLDLGADFEVCPGFSHDLEVGLVYPGFTVEYYLNSVKRDEVAIPWVYNNPPTAVPPYTVTEVGTWEVRIVDARELSQRGCKEYDDVIDDITLSFPVVTQSDPGDLIYCSGDTSVVNVTSTLPGAVYAWFETETPVGGTTGRLGSTIGEGTTTIDLSGITAAGDGSKTVYVERVALSSTTIFPRATPCTSNKGVNANNLERINFIFSVSEPTLIASMDVVLTSQTNTVGSYSIPYTFTIKNTGAGTNGPYPTTTVTTVNYNHIRNYTAGGVQEEIFPYVVNFNTLLQPGTYSISSTHGALPSNISNVGLYGCPSTASGTLTGNTLTPLGFSQANASGGFSTTSNDNYYQNIKFGESTLTCSRVPVVIEQECPCNAPATVTASSNPAAAGTPKEVSVCTGTGNLVTLSGVYTAGSGTTVNGYQYSWYKEGSTPTYTNNATVANRNLVAADAGTWFLRVEDGAAGSANCYVEDSIVVNIIPLPTAPSIGDVTGCVGETGLTIDTAGQTGVGTRLVWYTADAPATTGETLVRPTVSSTTAGTTTYYVARETSTAPNCESTTRDEVNVVINPNPQNLTITPGDTAYCVGTSYNLVASADASPAVTYTWYKGGTSTGTTSATQTGDATTTGSPHVYSVVADSAGCTDSVSVTVTINELPDGSISIDEDTICSTGTATVSMTTTSTATPFDFYYKEGTTSADAQNTSSPFDLTVSAIGRISLDSIVDVNGCTYDRISNRYRKVRSLRGVSCDK